MSKGIVQLPFVYQTALNSIYLPDNKRIGRLLARGNEGKARHIRQSRDRVIGYMIGWKVFSLKDSLYKAKGCFNKCPI